MIPSWQQQDLLIVTACSECVTQLSYTGTKCSSWHIFPSPVTQWIMQDLFSVRAGAAQTQLLEEI